MAALTEKRKKKLNRWIGTAEERFNIIYTDKVIEYFVLFCLVLLFDRIADIFGLWKVFRYHHGVGPAQIILSGLLIAQMVRYARRIKK